MFRFRNIITFLLSVILVVFFVLWLINRLLVDTLSHNDRLISLSPSDNNLEYEELYIDVKGRNIHAWWVPSASSKSPSVLIFHGQGETMDDWLNVLNSFHKAGFNSMVFDYSGYGKSSDFSKITEWKQDTLAVFKHFNEIDDEGNNKFLFGFSLGGGIIFDNLTELQPGICGSIVSSSFTSIRDMTVDWYNTIEVAKYMIPNLFNSIGKVGYIKKPMLLLHSTGDELVPVKHSQKLYSSSSDFVDYIEFNDHNLSHNTTWSSKDNLFIKESIKWIKDKNTKCI